MPECYDFGGHRGRRERTSRIGVRRLHERVCHGNIPMFDMDPTGLKH